MADNLTPEDRRRNMQAIRSSDTKPELVVRRFLHSHGFRFRLHVSSLPGNPDIVLPRYRTVVFVNGCFWHSHSCGRAVPPATRESYWIPKLERTIRRDRQNAAKLRATGWQVIRVPTTLTARARVERIRCFEAVAHRVGHQARQRSYRTRARGILDTGSGAYREGPNGGGWSFIPSYPLAYF
jgi:DNA mismatch endonuclease (patch repair protein)